MTSLLDLNELFAEEIRKLITSAVIVPTIAMDTDTVDLTSAAIWWAGSRRLTHMPSMALQKTMHRINRKIR